MTNGEPQDTPAGQAPSPSPSPSPGPGQPTPTSQSPTDTLSPFKGAEENLPDTRTFWQRIDDAIANLADLTVATLVTNVTVGVDKRGRLSSVTAPTTEVPAIITNLNLVDGNATTVVGPDLKDDTSLTNFHQGLVEKAVKVLPDNLKAVANLIELFFKKVA